MGNIGLVGFFVLFFLNSRSQYGPHASSIHLARKNWLYDNLSTSVMIPEFLWEILGHADTTGFIDVMNPLLLLK